MIFPLVVFVLASAAAAGAATVLPDKLPPHPRILVSASELPKIRQRIDSYPWAKSQFDRLKREAEAALKANVKLPDKGGQWYHYYSCPKHGARLKTEGPTRHVCPVDNEVFSGYPYDDVFIMGEHNRWAGILRQCGLAYQLTGDTRYAAKAKEVLLAYAERYEKYPLHNIKGEARVGGGKVGPQTLDESTWLIRVLEGADCIWPLLSAAEKQKVASQLIAPAVQVIRQHKMGIHNIQCWKNSAVGLAGLLLDNREWLEEAINGPSGYNQQMAKGVSADGNWYENAWGYHFYTVSALLHLTEGARNSGINLYGPELRRMFDAPLRLCMPDFVLPAFNDSHSVSLLGYLDNYEIAAARYPDIAFRQLLARGKRQTEMAMLCGINDAGSAGEFTPRTGNYTAAGNAVLSAGNGTNAAWLCLDYGPHGGGHGHPDKLGFVAYARGAVIAPDPGTANYGVPIQSEWFRTTIAHNTLTVDEESQKPAEGKALAFIAQPGFSAITASAGPIYPGVTFHRTIAMLGDNCIVFIDLAKADADRTFDFAYHNLGKLASTLPAARPISMPKKPGYMHLRNTAAVETSGAVSLEFTGINGATINWRLAAGAPRTIITGTGVGRHTEDRVPVVITRIRGRQAVVPWAVTLDSAPFTIFSEPVRTADGRLVDDAQAGAIRVEGPAGRHIIVANPGGLDIRVAGLALNAPLACLSAGPTGQYRITHMSKSP